MGTAGYDFCGPIGVDAGSKEALFITKNKTEQQEEFDPAYTGGTPHVGDAVRGEVASADNRYVANDQENGSERQEHFFCEKKGGLRLDNRRPEVRLLQTRQGDEETPKAYAEAGGVVDGRRVRTLSTIIPREHMAVLLG
jgi:hypothetical protein